MNIRSFIRTLASMAICILALAGPAPASVAPPEKTIAVIGSSVAAGWVTAREAGQDMKNGWAFRLARHLEPLGYKVVNVSVPGDTTEKVLARLDKDLLSLQPDIAVISLSLENEGIRGIGGRDPRKVYEGFGTNLRRIIAECRERNIVPVVASCYANDNFGDPATYRFIVDMNLEMASWGVPVINFLGALDRGDGRFVKGLTFDLDHPADRGHRELFLSIVPGLFEALAAGKPVPERDAGPGRFSVGKGGRGGYMSCVPADPLHSFSTLFEIRASGPGIAASVRGADGKFYRIAVAENGDAVLHASTGVAQRVPASLRDGNWHRIGWVHHYLKREMTLYIDGTAGPSITEATLPVQFLLGGLGEESPGVSPAAAEFRDWMIYRVPLNAAEMEAIQAGRLLPGSLEVFAPLRGGKPGVDSEVENRAQSASRVVFRPKDIPREIARLEDAIARQDREEVVYIDPNEKKPICVAPEILVAWMGVYEVAPGLVLTVVMEEGRLFLLVNGGDDGKTELFPSSAERFFVKSVGPQIEVSFQAEKGGRPPALVFKMDGQEMTGRRKETTGIKDVSCQQARDIIREHQRNSNFVILNFRTKEMFDQSHIRGAIYHDVFLTDIDDWLKSLDNQKVYLIYCTAGHRSGIALAKMKDMGFVNILHMNEGISLWKQSGYETVQDADRQTEPREQAANAIQPPNEVMDILGIRPGLVIGEVGAGRGRVTIHLVARVGEKGKIYANDIDADSLDYLKERCRRQGLSNVETILGLVDDARFPKNSLDLVFMAWVFHHVDMPVPLLKSLLPSLKPWGSVVMVEPTPESHGEESARMLTRELVGKEAREAGFELDTMIEGRLKEDNIFILAERLPRGGHERDQAGRKSSGCRRGDGPERPPPGQARLGRHRDRPIGPGPCGHARRRREGRPQG